MTDKQKEAVRILNDLRAQAADNRTAVMTDEEYFTLLEFVVDRQTEIQYVPQTFPWSTPGVEPYYTTSPGHPSWPSTVTCHFSKD